MDTSPVVRVPALVLFATGNPTFDWNYATEPDDTRNDRTDAWPRGRVVGGSGSINGQLFVRGQRSDYDGWAALGNPDWAYERVLPIFQELESYTGEDDANCRGRRGLLSVDSVRGPHQLSSAFVRAASDVGIPSTKDYNGESLFGASIAQVTQKRGWRHSSARAFLHPCLSRVNLTLETNAKVQKIDIVDGVARGVSYLHDGAAKTVRATREVVLAAGAIASPQLLLLSGIGDEAELTATRFNYPPSSTRCRQELARARRRLGDQARSRQYPHLEYGAQLARRHQAWAAFSISGQWTRSLLPRPRLSRSPSPRNRSQTRISRFILHRSGTRSMQQASSFWSIPRCCA